MRIKLILLLLLFVLTLSACTSSTTSVHQQQSTNHTEKQVVAEKEQGESPQVESSEDDQVQETVVELVPKAEPQYKINPENFNVEPIANAEKKVVLLTFDDAPDQHALEIAKILKNLDVGAIFFVNGHFLDTDSEKQVLKEIHDLGFFIGNHTMSHQNLKKLSEQEQYEEIVGVNDLVEEIIGERPKFFRAPFGANTEYSKNLAAEEKMVVMNWSYGYDFMEDYMNKDALADIMVNTNLLHNGANLLMHDRKWTKEALQDIVTGLQSKGYLMVDPHFIATP